VQDLKAAGAGSRSCRRRVPELPVQEFVVPCEVGGSIQSVAGVGVDGRKWTRSASLKIIIGLN